MFDSNLFYSLTIIVFIKMLDYNNNTSIYVIFKILFGQGANAKHNDNVMNKKSSSVDLYVSDVYKNIECIPWNGTNVWHT